MIMVFNGIGQLTQGNSGCHYIYTKIMIVIEQVCEGMPLVDCVGGWLWVVVKSPRYQRS